MSGWFYFESWYYIFILLNVSGITMLLNNTSINGILNVSADSIIIMLVYWLNNKAGKLHWGMGAMRLSLSCSHSSLTLSDSPLVWLPCMVAIIPMFCAACTLLTHCFHCVILCCHLSTPLLYVLLLFLSGMLVLMVLSRPLIWISIWCCLLASSSAVVFLQSFPS